MKLSSRLTSAGRPRGTADVLAQWERAGLDRIWIGESYGFDAPTLAGYVAARTEHVEIALGVLNIYSRTPAAILQTVAGLDEVSNGRAILGLGASGPQVVEGFHGIEFAKPLVRTREITEFIRRGLRREVLEHDGTFVVPIPSDRGTGLGKALKLMTRPVRAQVPIYIASLTPRSVQLTAQYADGWLPFLFHPDKSNHVWGDALADGAMQRDPGLAPLSISAGGLAAVGDGPEIEALLDLARPTFALYIGGMGARSRNFYNDLACSYGYEAEAKTIQDLYLAGRKEEAAAMVPKEWLQAANLIGPRSFVKERLEAFREAGVDDLQITPVGPDPMKTIEHIKELMQ